MERCTPHDDDFSRPVCMILGQQTIELDWWLNPFWSDKSRLKTWAGTSSPKSMLARLSDMIVPDATDVFNQALPATGSSRPTWGFDPRVARNTGVAGRLAKVKLPDHRVAVRYRVAVLSARDR